jgi:hypothetical protein
MRLWLVLILISSAIFSLPLSAFEIPKGLTSADRKEVVRTLGMNSATKILSNPYPLGGYSGFEVGYSVEFVNVRDMRRLGCTPGAPGCANTSLSDETEWRYSRLTIGKGLYSDLDVFFSFIPPAGGVRVSDYGAAARWSFYQARFLPINVAALFHFNQLNFNDTFMNRNYGAEIMVGVNVDNFAVYFGGGMLESQGTFISSVSGICGEDCTVDGGDTEVDRSSNTVTNKVTETHSVVGLSAHFENLFAAAQVDRYRDAVYSMKLGLRF